MEKLGKKRLMLLIVIILVLLTSLAYIKGGSGRNWLNSRVANFLANHAGDWTTTSGNNDMSSNGNSSSDSLMREFAEIDSHDNEKSCARFEAHKNLIGDSGDPSHTYNWPRKQLRFINSSHVVCDEHTQLFIAIKTAYKNFERRNIQRQSWLSPGRCSAAKESKLCELVAQRTRHAFFVSTPQPLDGALANQVQQEMVTYGDLVQSSFVEDYHNITLKTLSSLHWTVHHCPRAKYVISTDDDMILLLTNVWRSILALEDGKSGMVPVGDLARVADEGRKFHKNYLGGRTASNEKVHRGGQYAIKPTAYARNDYPVFLKGWFVFMTRDIVDLILDATVCVRLLWLDDVFLFGILAEALGVPRNGMNGLIPTWEYKPNNVAALCDSSSAYMYESNNVAASLWAACRHV